MMDILDETSMGVNKTKIVYRANLNFNMAKRYLPLLINRGLVSRVDGEDCVVYKITDRGREILKIYREIRKSV